MLRLEEQEAYRKTTEEMYGCNEKTTELEEGR